MKKIDDSALPSLALVFGYIAVKELQSTADRIEVLSRLGYGNEQIATICGTSRGRVAVSKSHSKKRKIKRGAKINGKK